MSAQSRLQYRYIRASPMSSKQTPSPCIPAHLCPRSDDIYGDSTHGPVRLFRRPRSSGVCARAWFPPKELLLHVECPGLLSTVPLRKCSFLACWRRASRPFCACEVQSWKTARYTRYRDNDDNDVTPTCRISGCSLW